MRTRAHLDRPAGGLAILVAAVLALPACSEEGSSGAAATAGSTGGTTGADVGPDTSGSDAGPEDGQEDTSGCTAGDKGCACLGDGTCSGNLTCSGGVCSEPAACPEGAQGCPCYPNDTCDAGSSCESGTCVAGATPGGLGDPCSTTAPCGQHEGKALECRDGTCALPGAGCTPGELACACKAGDLCDAGLECKDGLCAPETIQQGVTVGDAQARACGFVFDLAGATVTFDAQVIGRTRTAGDRVALAFTAKGDTTLTGPVVTITGPKGAATGLPLTQIECFDRHGAAIASPGVTLN